jgi:nanoRNase/pAp phosphatase (c-di-AMP/oligoRNAs hydrolase)
MQNHEQWTEKTQRHLAAVIHEHQSCDQDVLAAAASLKMVLAWSRPKIRIGADEPRLCSHHPLNT